MAFTREYIRKLAKESDVELPKEFIDGLISEHINARDVYADEQVKSALENNSSRLKSNIEDSEEYKKIKKLYDDEKIAHKKLKDDIAIKEAKAKKESAYRQLLKEAGISEKRIESVLKVSNLSNIELDENGKIKDVEGLTKSIKSEWSDFIVTSEELGENVSKPPSNNGKSGFVGRAKQLAAEYYANQYGTNNNTVNKE